jgi:tetratricopeptide (TPR) repeat protein
MFFVAIMFMFGGNRIRASGSDIAFADFWFLISAVLLLIVAKMRGTARYYQRNPAKQAEKDIARLNRLLQIDPEEASAHLERGRAFAVLQEYQRAASDYDRAIEIYPQYAEAYSNRAIVLTLLKRDPEAQQDVDRAVELGLAKTVLDFSTNQAKHSRDATTEFETVGRGGHSGWRGTAINWGTTLALIGVALALLAGVTLDFIGWLTD